MKRKKIVILSLLILLFIINTILVYFDLTIYIDDKFHVLLYGLYSSRIEKIMNTITFFGCTKWMILFSCVLFILYLKKHKNKSFIVASIIIISTICNNLIKIIVRRDRPLNMLVYESTFSYPSGHMMASTTLYGLLIYFLCKSNYPKKYKIIYSFFLSILILLIGFSRIYLRAHYLTDVFGGMLCSLILITVLDILNDKYKWIK